MLLTAAPLSDVVIKIGVDDATEVAVNSETLTFTPGNWNLAQAVEITGVDDVTVDGTVDSLVSFTILASESDAAFLELDDQTVLLKTTDDDEAGLIVFETDQVTRISESGTKDSILVSLSHQPQSAVTVEVESSGENQMSLNVSSLHFTSENWSQPQTVEVIAVPDLKIEPDGIESVVFQVSEESDPFFSVIAPDRVDVTIEDHAFSDLVLTAENDSFVLRDQDTGIVIQTTPLATLDQFSLSLSSRSERIRVSIATEIDLPVEIDTGGGDDIIEIERWSQVVFQGGEGIDELVLVGEPSEIRFSELADGSLSGIETIDIRGNGTHFLDVSAVDLERVFDNPGQVTFAYGSEDQLELVDSWQVVAPAIQDGVWVHQLVRDGFTLQIVNDVDWQNPMIAGDVNHDGSVTALDALLVINHISRNGNELPTSTNDTTLRALL